jgi:hypothetical protein
LRVRAAFLASYQAYRQVYSRAAKPQHRSDFSLYTSDEDE